MATILRVAVTSWANKSFTADVSRTMSIISAASSSGHVFRMFRAYAIFSEINLLYSADR